MPYVGKITVAQPKVPNNKGSRKHWCLQDEKGGKKSIAHKIGKPKKWLRDLKVCIHASDCGPRDSYRPINQVMLRFQSNVDFCLAGSKSRLSDCLYGKAYALFCSTTGETIVRGAGMVVMPSFGSKFRYCVSTDVSFIRPPGPLTCTAVFCKRKDGGQNWCQASTDMYS